MNIEIIDKTPKLREPGTYIVVLDEGERARGLISTGQPYIYGPATVRYIVHPDGGINIAIDQR